MSAFFKLSANVGNCWGEVGCEMFGWNCEADNIWITSNLHPKDWYQEDQATIDALLRRLEITEIKCPFQ